MRFVKATKYFATTTTPVPLAPKRVSNSSIYLRMANGALLMSDTMSTICPWLVFFPHFFFPVVPYFLLENPQQPLASRCRSHQLYQPHGNTKHEPGLCSVSDRPAYPFSRFAGEVLGALSPVRVKEARIVLILSWSRPDARVLTILGKCKPCALRRFGSVHKAETSWSAKAVVVLLPSFRYWCNPVGRNAIVHRDMRNGEH